MAFIIGSGITIGTGISFIDGLPTAPPTVEYLVVAGGGGGGSTPYNGGSGGGGGSVSRPKRSNGGWHNRSRHTL